MAKRSNFAGTRWLVVSGVDPLCQYAAAEAAALIQQHVPYVVQTFVGGCDRARLKRHHLLLVGTARSNPLLAAVLRDKKVARPMRPQSYRIRVLPSPFGADRQALVLAGADARGVLYAARDFEHYGYDPWQARLAGHSLPLPHVAKAAQAPVPFHVPVPAWFDRDGAPAVAGRGIWTWGHVVYDYHAFLEHMSRWKMNMLICWNDFAPVNARQVVAHAHRLGIDVIWGYTWCWGEPVDPHDRRQLARWTDRVIRTYEDQYAGCGGDGIYFQTFTETHDETLGRKTIAELATTWVNHIAGALLDRHSGLSVQFGVHAISIRDNYRRLAKVDPRVSIVWEDAGGFPYTYDVTDVGGIDQTVAYTRRLAGLRGRGEDVGFVLKGMRSLDWPTFEHQRGPFVMGRADRDFIRRRAARVARRWKRVEVGWRANLQAVCRTIRAAVAARPKRLTITGLVEDGMWEQTMFAPPCFLAEALWDPREKPARIVEKVAATRDAHCLA